MRGKRDTDSRETATIAKRRPEAKVAPRPESGVLTALISPKSQNRQTAAVSAGLGYLAPQMAPKDTRPIRVGIGARIFPRPLGPGREETGLFPPPCGATCLLA